MQKIHSTKVPLAKFTSSGNIMPDSDKECAEAASYGLKQYYSKWNELNVRPKNGENAAFGLAGKIATFECASGAAIAAMLPSPATKLNLVTSIAEFAQFFIGSLQDIDVDKITCPQEKIKAETKNQFKSSLREDLVSGSILIAGVAGLISFFKGIKNNDEHNAHDLPLIAKLGLTGASLFNTAMMTLGYFEKGSIAPFVQNIDAERSGEIRSNASSDGRCAIEWTVMAALPWLGNSPTTKFLKSAFDFSLPALATFDSGLELIKKYIMKSADDELKIPWLIKNSWYLGTEQRKGIRDLLINPFLKFCGLTPPTLYQNSNEEFVIASHKSTQQESSPLITHETSNRRNEEPEFSRVSVK